MDWNRVEGNWKQVKGKVKEQWGKLTDDDLDQIDGQRRCPSASTPRIARRSGSFRLASRLVGSSLEPVSRRLDRPIDDEAQFHSCTA